MWLCILECEKHLANTFARVTICHTYSWSKPIHILYYHYLHLRPTFGSFVSVNARISYFTMWTVDWVTHSDNFFYIPLFFFKSLFLLFFQFYFGANLTIFTCFVDFDNFVWGSIRQAICGWFHKVLNMFFISIWNLVMFCQTKRNAGMFSISIDHIFIDM